VTDPQESNTTVKAETLKSGVAAELVAVYRDAGLRYPDAPPYDPAALFPEYPFGPGDLAAGNRVYGAVRDTLALAGLDAERFGSPDWNPLGELVAPGGTVMIKPNWVRHYHLRDEDLFSLITHPSVLRPLVDYAYRAVGDTGRIWIMDAPLFDTDFAELSRKCRLEEFQAELRRRGVPLTIGDLRSLVVRTHNGVIIGREYREVWESEGVEFDLADRSEFIELGPTLQNVFGSDYDRRVTQGFHVRRQDGSQRHCYRISRRVLDADLVISVPKLKTHKKTGVTLNIKNMIGINTDKNYIPHYRVGAPAEGGDEFPDANGRVHRLRRRMVRHAVDVGLGRLGRLGSRAAHAFMSVLLPVARRGRERRSGRRLDPIDIFYQSVQGDVERTGNWWGNDTCWRCGIDINRVLRYGRADGSLAPTEQRRYLSLVDGVVGGEDDGPLAPTPRPEGVLLAGFDAVRVDTVAVQLMGLDPGRVRDLRRARQGGPLPLTDPGVSTSVASNYRDWQGGIAPGTDLGFKPHPNWVAYLGNGRG
jgi:uncharacterized protein (DUF362 family)